MNKYFFLKVIVACFLLGAFFSGALAALSVITFFVWLQFTGVRSENSQKSNFLNVNEDFIKPTLALAAYFTKADLKAKSEEQHYIRQRLEKSFSQNKADRFYEIYLHFLKHKIDLNRIVRDVKRRYSATEKVQLLYFLVGLITVDGELSVEEEHKLFSFTRKINMAYSSLRSILGMFKFEHERVKHERKQQYQKSKNNTATKSRTLLQNAFQVFDLPVNSSVEVIKKRYRKLAKKHHPDKVIHLGEEMQLRAKEKFQVITAAYNYIKEYKKF